MKLKFGTIIVTEQHNNPRYGSIGFQREVLGFVFAILQKMTVKFVVIYFVVIYFVVIYFALFALVLYRARSPVTSDSSQANEPISGFATDVALRDNRSIAITAS